MPAATARSIADVLAQSRTLLQDTVATAGMAFRYGDQDLIDNLNGAMIEARRIRPDLFLTMGLRTPLPVYTTADKGSPTADPAIPSTLFPLDEQYFMAIVYYVVGRSELREDTFTDNSRAVNLMNKFVSQLTALAA